MMRYSSFMDIQVFLSSSLFRFSVFNTFFLFSKSLFSEFCSFTERCSLCHFLAVATQEVEIGKKKKKKEKANVLQGNGRFERRNCYTRADPLVMGAAFSGLERRLFRISFPRQQLVLSA